MARHGGARHARYDRLARKRQLNTRDGGRQAPASATREQKRTESHDLHGQSAFLREKRQQAAIPPTPVTQTVLTDTTNEPTLAAATDQVAPATTTAAASDLTSTISEELPSTTDTPPTEATTTPSETVTPEVITETITTPTSGSETATSTSTPETETASGTITASVPTPTRSSETAKPSSGSSISTSVPVIAHPTGGASETPISLGSSVNVPTAVISVHTTPTPTSTLDSIAAIISSSSTSGSTETTESTSTATDASTSSSETTTTETSYSHPSSPNPSDFGSGNEGGSGNNTGEVPSPDPSSSGSLNAKATGKIVGGVVGGVAGATLLILLLFLLLRRQRKGGLPLGSARGLAAAGTGDGGGLARENSRRQMVSRDSNKDSIFTASYFAPAFAQRWRRSQRATADESILSSEPSERGFQKISGRKLPTGMRPSFEYASGGVDAWSPTVSEASPTTPPVLPRSLISSQPPPSVPYGMPLDASYTRESAEDEDVVVIRPSPARTLTTESANATWNEASARTMALSFPMPPTGPITIPKRPDVLGRSHPSFDGSRGSRFTESL